MSRLVETLDRVTWLLERMSELATGEAAELPPAALRSAVTIAEDYALLRPILTALLTTPTIPESPQAQAKNAFAESSFEDAASEGGPTHGNARFNRYVQSGVGQVEAFALATSPLASALFDRVIAAGLEPGPAMELAAELLVKEIWYTGLHLPAERILIAPRLLADLATYAAGKPSCIKAVVKLLPELCQGLSPDALMGRVMTAKTEVRKALLKRHMAALDEAEGLQDITTRLSERMGIDPRTLRSDSPLDIPLHVRAYLAKHERTRGDMELLRDMETQIVVLRAVGAREAAVDESSDEPKPMRSALAPRDSESVRELRDFLSGRAYPGNRPAPRSAMMEHALSSPCPLPALPTFGSTPKAAALTTARSHEV